MYGIALYIDFHTISSHARTKSKGKDAMLLTRCDYDI